MSCSLVKAFNEGKVLSFNQTTKTFSVVEGSIEGMAPETLIQSVDDLRLETAASTAFRQLIEGQLSRDRMDYNWYSPVKELLFRMHASDTHELAPITTIFRNAYGLHCRLDETTEEFLKKDPEFVIRCMEAHGSMYSKISAGHLFSCADESLKENTEFVLDLMRRGFPVFYLLSRSLQSNPAFVIEVLKIDCSSVCATRLPYEMLASKDFVLELLKFLPYAVGYVSPELKKDRDVAMTALEAKPGVYSSLDDCFQEDEDIARFAISASGSNYLYAPPKIRKMEEMAVCALSQSYSIYSNLEPEFKANPNILLHALRLNPHGGSLTLKEADMALREDYNLMRQACSIHADCFMNISSKFQDDDEIANLVIQKAPQMIAYASDRLKADKSFALTALSISPGDARYVFEHLDPALKKDKDVVLKLFSQDPVYLKYSLECKLDEELSQNRDFILSMISLNACGIEHAHETLLNDPEFLKEAYRVNPDVLNSDYFSLQLITDESFVRKILDAHPDYLGCLHGSFRDDLELLMPYLLKNPKLYEFLCKTLKENKDLVLELIALDSSVYDLVSKGLKKDVEIAAAALRKANTFTFLHLIDGSLKSSPDFGLAAIELISQSLTWRHISNWLDIPVVCQNELFVIKCLEKGIDSIIKHIPQELRANKEIAKLWINLDPSIYVNLPRPLKEDLEILEVALSKEGGNLQYAPESIKRNKEFVLKAVAHRPFAIQCADDSLKSDHDVVTLALNANAMSYRFIGPALKENLDYAVLALNQNGLTLQYMTDAFKDDLDLVTRAIEQNPEAFQYASERLRAEPELVQTVLARRPDLMSHVAFAQVNSIDLALFIVRQDGQLLQRLNPDLRANREVVLAALHNTIEARHFIPEALLNDPEIRTLLLNQYAALIHGRRYLPCVVPEAVQTKMQALAEDVGEGSVDHLLTEDLPSFISTLSAGELGVGAALVEERKAALNTSLNRLRDRIEHKIAFLGTPRAHEAEQLHAFYDHIKAYLRQLDAKLSARPDMRSERLQILEGADVCGGGLLAQLQQLHYHVVSSNAGLSCAAQLTKWRNEAIYTFIEESVAHIAEAEGSQPNVHDKNIITWQLRDFLGGSDILFDHLANQQDEVRLISSLFERRGAAQLVRSLIEDLKTNEELKDAVLEFVNNDMFDGEDPSEAIVELLTNEREEVEASFTRIQEIRADLTIDQDGAPQAIEPKIFEVIKTAPRVELLKKQLAAIFERDVTLEEAAKYFERKALIQEMNLHFITIKTNAGVTREELQGLDLAGVLERCDAFRESRIRDLKAESFLKEGRDEEGHFTEGSVAQILHKVGLLREV